MPDRRRTCSFRPVPHVGVALRLCMLLVLGCLPLLPTPVAAAHAPLLVEATTGRTRLPVRAAAAAPVAPLVASQSLTATTTLTGTQKVITLLITPTQDLVPTRTLQTATRLQDGTVLFAGGKVDTPTGGERTADAQIFDPATDTFTATGSLIKPRRGHSATLLQSGKVLIIGGTEDVVSAEIYDPATGSFTTTGSLQEAIDGYTTTLLNDDKVLIAGGGDGYSTRHAEIYDLATGTFAFTEPPNVVRYYAVSVRLPDGDVLLAGGTNDKWWNNDVDELERYDADSGTFTVDTTSDVFRTVEGAVNLPDGRVLFVGPELIIYDPASHAIVKSIHIGQPAPSANVLQSGDVLLIQADHTASNLSYVSLFSSSTYHLKTIKTTMLPNYSSSTTLLDGDVLVVRSSNDGSTERIRWSVANNFTGTLTLPTWAKATTPITFTGTTVKKTLASGRLNDGPLVAAQEGVPMTTTIPSGLEGNRTVTLHLVDSAGTTTPVVTGTVNVDTRPPSSTFTALPTTSPMSFTLRWSATDSGIGVATYDVDVRDGLDQPWQPLLTTTTLTQTTFSGTPDHTYFFRVRARDALGNVEAWPVGPDAQTIVDTVPPRGSFSINSGARATTGREVTIEPNMTDRSGVPSTRINLDGTWSDWRAYFTFDYFDLPASDGEKVVAMQFRDGVGNISDPITRTIILNRVVGTTPGVSIADGADFTNVPTVTLEISAPTYTTEMMISNDGGFRGAQWQPFDIHPTWRISTAGGYRLPRTVYVRTRAWARGNVVQSTQDDIIFDPQPPTGEVEITSVGATTVKVRTPASDPDDLSRVARVRVSLNAQFTGATWQPYRQDNPVSTLARSGSGAVTVYAQWEDGAGNLSAVRSASTNQNATATPTRTTGPSVTPTPTPSASPTATRTAQPSPTTTAPRDSHVYLPLVRR